MVVGHAAVAAREPGRGRTRSSGSGPGSCPGSVDRPGVRDRGRGGGPAGDGRPAAVAWSWACPGRVVRAVTRRRGRPHPGDHRPLPGHGPAVRGRRDRLAVRVNRMDPHRPTDPTRPPDRGPSPEPIAARRGRHRRQAGAVGPASCDGHGVRGRRAPRPGPRRLVHRRADRPRADGRRRAAGGVLHRPAAVAAVQQRRHPAALRRGARPARVPAQGVGLGRPAGPTCWRTRGRQAGRRPTARTRDLPLLTDRLRPAAARRSPALRAGRLPASSAGCSPTPWRRRPGRSRPGTRRRRSPGSSATACCTTGSSRSAAERDGRRPGRKYRRAGFTERPGPSGPARSRRRRRRGGLYVTAARTGQLRPAAGRLPGRVRPRRPRGGRLPGVRPAGGTVAGAAVAAATKVLAGTPYEFEGRL